MPRSTKFWQILTAMLFGAALLYFLGAHRVPLWDRDEPWYAQCSREMLQSGDWVVPRFLGEWRKEKPPVIYWCQLAAMKVAGDTPEAARFPSTIAVLVTALLIGAAVRHFTGDRRALWTVFIFCTCGLTISCAKFCITDGVLLLFMVIGQISLALMYSAGRRGENPPWWTAPAFWISLGLAGITKGPQALGMHLFTLIILLAMDVARDGMGFASVAAWKKNIRWWRNLKPIMGLPILIAVVAPWLVLLHERAPGFIMEMFLTARMHLAQSMQGHGKPPGYHALLIFGTFFPWSVLLPTTLVLAWRNRRLPVIRFAIAATAGPWLMMEIVYTKLPFYVLPAFGGLAFLAADALVRCVRGQCRDLRKPIFFAMLTAWILATLGIGAALWLSLLVAKSDQLPIDGFIAFSAAAAIYAGLVFLRFYQGRIARAAVVMGMGMAVMIAVLYTRVLPGMNFLHLPERLASDLTALGAYGADVHVAMIGYDEPSLAFYQGGGARKYDVTVLQITPPAEWPRWIVMADDDLDWKQLSPQLQAQLVLRAVETGLNYSHDGKMVRVLILENRGYKSKIRNPKSE
ncbi:MAG: glycosyltransferase family 39 protein [Tepidisphaeraceae bacterium]|jgi:4-amino-4-deoxy-L-arabinose transferase-like glycosyltransferase